MKTRVLSSLFSASVLIILLSVAGCSSKGDLLKEISGSWQNNQGREMVEINLAGSNKSMKINGKSYSLTVDKVEMDRYQVDLKVENGGMATELWTLREVWNDNGTDFKLAFDHGDKKDTLIHKENS